jgi:4-amino-4-deoxy-L-arabinose transferase-like glycosyltransferase
MNFRDLWFVSDGVLPRGIVKKKFLAAKQSWDLAVLTRSLILGLIISLAIGLRVWGLNGTGFNTDEAVYAGQAAAIARDPILKDIFPVFRAHPLLFQFVLALLFHFGVTDIGARLIAVAVGLLTVYVVYRLGDLLYGRTAGMLAGLILALMPYHVVVTRQVLLDGPMVLCSTITLYMLGRFAATERPVWLYSTGAAMGLTFLAKETGIILMGAIYAFLALSREIRVRILDLIFASVCVVLMMVPFPAALLLAGGTKSGKQYLVWQLFRRPNHPWEFYPTTVPVAMGLLVVGAALLGLWLLRSKGTWRERLLICWIVVPVAFFQLWPTKGFQYLLPTAPAVAILAARALAHWPITKEIHLFRWRLSEVRIRVVGAGIVALSLLVSSWLAIQPSTSGSFVAGTGGVPGGREAGIWIRDHTPQGAKLMTIGPSMANIIQFYGHRRAYGLSVSPNPLRRNPSYEPILNPDSQIRLGDLHYLVWDSFSAERSSFFSEGLLRFIDKYHGRVVHVESVMVKVEDGSTVAKPVIIIYEVRP